MRAVAIVLSLSICAMDFLTAPAIASVMDGKGSPRSYRGEAMREKAFERLKKKEAGKKTCSSYAKLCGRNNANSPACQTSYSNCMATGVFVGPKGATFSGMTRQ
jgi:hypothetical protein